MSNVKRWCFILGSYTRGPDGVKRDTALPPR
jgi:hypothetical protein